MIQNKNIIIVYGPPWDQPAQLSKHQFARLWSKENRVLYIEAPINPFSFIKRKKEAKYLWKKYKSGYQKVSDSLWVTIFFYLLPFRGSKYLFGGKWINWINPVHETVIGFKNFSHFPEDERFAIRHHKIIENQETI